MFCLVVRLVRVSGVASMEQMEQLLPPRTVQTTFVIHANPMGFLGDWRWGRAGVW